MLSRHGASLLELLVAMALAAIVLATATSSLLHQQHSAAAEGARARDESQLRAGLAGLAATLAGLSPAAGDLAAGEARDTAIQVRIAVASAFACDDAVGQASFAAGDSGARVLTGLATTPKAGDTLWWYGGDGAGWSARRIGEVSEETAVCALAGRGTSPAIRLALLGADSVHRGAPLRITRQVRYSLYHAGDGSWQFGLSEWSETTQRFAPPQPVAGPFLRTAPGGGRTGFRYFDAAGTELPAEAQAADPTRVVRMRLTAFAVGSLRAFGGFTHADSIDVSLERAAAP